MSEGRPLDGGAGAAASAVIHSTARRTGPSLSVKLILLTVLFVMATGIAGLVPSIAAFRLRFLEDRIATAQAASVLLDSDAWRDVSQATQDELLRSVGATAIVLHTGPATRLLAAADMPQAVDGIVDLASSNTLNSIGAAFETILAAEPRMLRVLGPVHEGASLELVISDRPLRAALLRFAGNILILSAAISIIAAIPIFISLQRLFVRPMRQLSAAIMRFAEDPEDKSRIIAPSGRADEIGVAETDLAAMQSQLSDMLAEKRHLADLGLAVSKVNHDLRNLLAAAQLFSDRIAALPDPAVQRFAPKLIVTLGRAIDYCQTTLAYGRAREREPARRLVALTRVARDVVEVLGLDQHATIGCAVEVPPGFEIDADPDQLFRVLLNLCRNAMQAMEGDGDPAIIRRIAIEAERQGTVAILRVRDTGPGVPERAKASLFQAFQGGVRPGGTGLGLAIAAEIIRAHGGQIGLVEMVGPGAVFEISIPDRPVALDRARHARAQAS
ncbi:sensor histidine kinase [Kaistia algarum]|uniref:sensor histidine kinase n=1 Tax=Kaistia algarum TaxID=2083279 RepID=UPI00225776F4|nr:HAMP domain-containing sensor histidine kinase [Kaistia algarum]MCX5516610.1 HAMP domain-containing sensor histidine kinase [Kaistia algarum]